LVVTVIGYHASHEQFGPSRLRDAVVRAEAAGFDAAMCSDHLAPWTPAQGESGFAWSWLGAALQATSLPMGVVTAPGQRYHPVVIGHAAAMLEAMFPGRFWMALGSGEALNEHVTGDPWPDKAARNARLETCASVIRRLLAGDEVDVRTPHVQVHRARLWSRPAAPPPVLAAALSPETAGWAASWAEGLITVHAPRERLQRIVHAFRERSGEARRLALQLHLAWAPTEDEAWRTARLNWAANALPSDVLADEQQPEAFAAKAEQVDDATLGQAVMVSGPGPRRRRHRQLRRAGLRPGLRPPRRHRHRPLHRRLRRSGALASRRLPGSPWNFGWVGLAG
jgi:coenzyme F420-dependent glucose-6-phosphate dehydrogenase